MLQRHGFQAAVEMIGPAVIAALKFVGPAFVERDHERAAMRALVMHDVDLAVRAAHHHDRLAAEIVQK